MAIKKLGRRTDQRLQLIYSQTAQLLWHGKIETTVDRAKSVKRVAEKIIKLAVRSFQDTVEVKKQRLNQKNEKVDVKVVNDGPQKLAVRRKIMSILPDLQEIRDPQEKKADYKERTKDINHPLVEKIFREYAPKYFKREEDLGQGGGYTRIVRLGNRRGDNAETCILELV
ncbi:MAG: bL17 family ribosomal protein [Christensenellales bacterium]|jgi:large subunit ribosomal protein L17|nr:50S ribosomal protein L17 [Clostridiales bacterium]